LVHEAVFLEP